MRPHTVIVLVPTVASSKLGGHPNWRNELRTWGHQVQVPVPGAALQCQLTERQLGAVMAGAGALGLRLLRLLQLLVLKKGAAVLLGTLTKARLTEACRWARARPLSAPGSPWTALALPRTVCMPVPAVPVVLGCPVHPPVPGLVALPVPWLRHPLWVILLRLPLPLPVAVPSWCQRLPATSLARAAS